MKVEVAVLDSPSLIVRTVSQRARKATLNPVTRQRIGPKSNQDSSITDLRPAQAHQHGCVSTV